MAKHGNYTLGKVGFPSHGETVVGVLYRPKGDGPFPTIVVLGPYSFQKKQAPSHYATRLADEVFLTLAFDPRTVGESNGMPRRLENPKMKNEDVVSALDYMLTRPDVALTQVFLLGICQGGPEMLDVASYDDRVKAVTAATGYYRDRETDLFTIAAGVSENPFDAATAPSTDQWERCWLLGLNAPAMPRLATKRQAKSFINRSCLPISATRRPVRTQASPDRRFGAGTAPRPSKVGRSVMPS